MTQNPTSAGNKKISNYIMTIVVIVLVLSIVSIILAVIVALNGGSTKPERRFNSGFPSGYWCSCDDHVNVHTVPVTETSSTNEN